METTLNPTFNFNEASSRVEGMRDFCGHFYDKHRVGNTLRNRNLNLITLIPEATRKAVEDHPRDFCVDPESKDNRNAAYREMLSSGFENILSQENNSIPNYKLAKEYLEDCINGKWKSIEETSDDVIAAICDIYYIDSVSASVELAAINLMKERGLYCGI